MEGLVCYELNELADGRFLMTYNDNEDSLQELEDKLGFRILMTDRHAWPSEEIVQAYHGQSTVEQAFKNIKNPFHLALTPEFHWTDQKIRVHYFSCVLGYLLATLVWKEAREKAGFKGTVGNLFETLNNIRLATLVEVTGRCGQSKVIRKLEELTDQQDILLEALGLAEIHKKPLKLKGLGVYNDSNS